MESTTVTSTLQNKPLSRYRSVRNAATLEAEKPPVPWLPEHSLSVAQQPTSRTPSRYHRKTAVQRAGEVSQLALKRDEMTPADYQMRATTGKPHATRRDSTSSTSSSDTDASPRIRPAAITFPCEVAGSPAITRRTTRYRSRTTTISKTKAVSPSRSYDAARQEARAILEGEHDRLFKLKQKQEELEEQQRQQAQAQATASALTGSHSALFLPLKPRKRTIEGSSRNSPTTTALTTASLIQAPPAEQPTLNRKVSRVVRRNRPEEPINGSSPTSGSPPPGFVDQPNLNGRERHPTVTGETPKTHTYEPKAGDGPPKTAITAPITEDTPLAAISTGERRVEIRYGKSKITLPITPSTTARELLNSASTIMSQPIDPRTSILIETYKPLGLERPLRRYEHIRDVVNSWDSDTQNYFMIMPGSECDAKGLEQKEAPKNQPSNTILNLYHSQKPGKWERHCVTLKEDGQVTASKTENGGNATNIFHLSDFDVYMPTKRETKKLKPPKKICFAIKSQQRSIMFESTENFVHFFSTNDRAIADEWYNAVQAWRSWYLVNVLDQGGAAKPPLTSVVPMGMSPSPPRPSTSHSTTSTPYQLGTFKPLLEFSVDAFRYEERMGEGQRPTERRSTDLKPSASPKRSKTLVNKARNHSNPEKTNTVLQRATSTKRAPPPASKTPRGLVLDGRNEIKEARGGPVLINTDEGFTGKGLLARAFSVKKPQNENNVISYDNTGNAFTGKGLLARKMSTQQFVSENAFVAENTNDAFTGGGLLSRKMSTKKFINENVNLPENTNDAFVGNGLVSRSLTKKRSQAIRPGQPLVELTATSEFADRSLLRDVEEYEISHGQNLPVIDRSKTTEVIAKTGEV